MPEHPSHHQPSVNASEVAKPRPYAEVTNEMVRFNQNLDGQNPDFNLEAAQPTDDDHRATEPELQADQAIKAREAISNVAPADRIKPNAELKPTPKQAAELDTVVFLANPSSDAHEPQAFSALKVNWPGNVETGPNAKIDQTVTVFLPAWLSDVKEGPTHLRVEQIALQMPETPLLALNMPSLGDSDNLTRAQRQALDAGEGFASITAPMLAAMKAAGLKNINIVGTSMGAAAASSLIAQAHEYGISVHEAILVDAANAHSNLSPGAQKKALKAGYLKESRELDRYHSFPQSEKMREATWQGKWFKKLKEVALVAKPLVTGRGKDTLSRFTGAMATGDLESNLHTGLENQSSLHVTLLNGGDSPISSNEANNSIADHLKAGHPGQVERVIRSGDTHSVLEDPQTYGHFVRQTIELAANQPK